MQPFLKFKKSIDFLSMHFISLFGKAIYNAFIINIFIVIARGTLSKLKSLFG